MNNSLFKIASALLIAVGLTATSFANPISGNITFAGGVTLDSNSAGSATQVVSWVTPNVQSVSGDFGTYVSAGDTVILNAPWSFNSGTVSNFWSVGGFKFDLISSSIVFQGFGAVVVNGVGTASGNNFDPYAGTWSFTTQDRSANGVFSFSGGSSVPDSGTTALLLGTALVGMSVVARRRKAV